MNPHFETLQAKLKDVEVIILDSAAAYVLRFTVAESGEHSRSQE
jgi:hypothetical protein